MRSSQIFACAVSAAAICLLANCSFTGTTRASDASQKGKERKHATGLAKVLWGRRYGGSHDDTFRSVIACSRGGYIAVGTRDDQVLVVKVTSEGTPAWIRTFGIRGNINSGDKCVELANQSLMILGRTRNRGDVDSQVYMLRLRANGEQIAETPLSVIDKVSLGGGLAHTGNDDAVVFSASVLDVHDKLDVELIKISADATILWRKTFGGDEDDEAIDIVQARDGGLFVTGSTSSFGATGTDMFIAKANTLGELQWNKLYRLPGDQVAWCIRNTRDDGFVICGWTKAFSMPGNECVVIKTTAAGEMEWQKAFGSACGESARSIYECKKGGFVLCGTTCSSGAGSWDVLLLRIGAKGEAVWKKTMGTKGNDYGESILEAPDGSFILAGALGEDEEGKGDGLGWSDAYLSRIAAEE